MRAFIINSRLIYFDFSLSYRYRNDNYSHLKVLAGYYMKQFMVKGSGAIALLLALSCSASDVDQDKLALGKKLYFDSHLSEPAGQSCASCHLPSAGFSDPDAELPVSRGVNPRHFGNRNTPTTAYAAFSPEFHFNEEEKLYMGGFFHDGRAATLEEQAKGPFLNPVEMGNQDAAMVITKIAAGDYVELFEQVYGKGALQDVEQAFDQVADAIASFERSEFFSPFSSKYDFYLRGEVELTAQEKRGLTLFEDEEKGNCAACHPSSKREDGSYPLFTDFSYDNLGVPKLKESPFYSIDPLYNPEGAKVIDLGLGAVLNKPEENGKFKVSSLRNIALTGPYMHNGIFTTLEEVVEFYNTRDKDDKWDKPEVAENMNDEELGDLGLSKQEEADIVAFLKTLTDGYQLPAELATEK